MMLSTRTNASKKHPKNQNSPRSPLKLKDLNVVASCSSSCSSCTTVSSISSEAPSGCLRFFLSHHSSNNTGKNVSKLKCNVVDKTPKSAPNVRRNVVKKRSNLQNPGKITSRKVKRNPPVPHLLKSGEKFSSRYDVSDGVNKLTSGFKFKLSDDYSVGVNKSRKSSSRCDVSEGLGNMSSGFELNLSNNAVNGRKPSSRYDDYDGMRRFSSGCQLDSSDDSVKFTPVNKLGCGFGLDRFNKPDKSVKLGVSDVNCDYATRCPTPPPVQASVSPEIQGELMSVVAATPTTCYAAGHVLSGVTDKRKCRPKGILTIGNNDLFGSSKTKGFCNEGEDNVVGDLSNRRDSIVPSPIEASVCWLSSPCDEKRSESEDDGDYDITHEPRLNEVEKLVSSRSVGCTVSPSSSLGFSSDLFNKSNSTSTISTIDAITTPNSRRSRSSVLHSDLSSEFRGVLGPSFDHLLRSSSSPSPVASPICQVSISPEQGKCDHERDATPGLEDSVVSMNVMLTPESNSSPHKFGLSNLCSKSNSRTPMFILSDLSRDEISRLWFESELDSVAEVLRRVSLSPDCQMPVQDSPRPSFEFNPLIKLDTSVDLTLFRKAMDTETLDISDTLLHNSPEPEVRISWREGLASRMFEMDELDCCRYLSDEEDNTNGCSDTSVSCSHSKITATSSDDIVDHTCDPNTSLQLEDIISRDCRETLPSEEPRCLEPINDGGRYTHDPEDSTWSVCYKNNLFQV